ncbi:MAG: flagellar hook-associated protein FlgK [Pseudomonadota bacterium]
MSITSALSSANSGLTAFSKAAQLVSDNVSNALTEGYARRELELSTRVVGGSGAGVQVDGVKRIVDQGLLRDRRLADAELGYQSGRTGFLQTSLDLIGVPDDPASLSGQLVAFESALLDAGSRPDSDTRLAEIVRTGNNLTNKLNEATRAVQAERLAADNAIAREIDILNANLKQVEEMNAEITRFNGSGQDTSGLVEARQLVIDDIAAMVPVRVVPRESGTVAIYTMNGATLIDGPAQQFEFSPVSTITADMTLASGALSPLIQNGDPVATTGQFPPMGGGSLAALFEVRDDLAVLAQARLDAFSRDLMERFEDPAVDPTTAAGALGLFTDNGVVFDALDEVGLAGRVELNAVVDPARGGDLTLIRDGLGATVPGPVGFAGQIYAFADALSSNRAPAGNQITSAERSATALSADLASRAASDLVDAERSESFASTRQTSLRDLELEGGVDTDQEMQKLLLIEQAYAANARVIQTIDDLIQRLLAI